MIVLDASAAVAGLLNDGAARSVLRSDQLHAPHLVDAEVASALRARVRAGQLSADAAWPALEVWRRLAVTRYAASPLLERVWNLRDNVSAYDGCYVALAELLGCPLVTVDGRLGRAPGLRCALSVLPG